MGNVFKYNLIKSNMNKTVFVWNFEEEGLFVCLFGSVSKCKLL